MEPTQALTVDQRFFFEHACFSYDPKTETPDQGRTRCAVDYASAETWARAAGLSFEWGHDPISPREWRCLCHSHTGDIAASRYGVDFGKKDPWSDPYRRVIEAELAQQVYLETMESAA